MEVYSRIFRLLMQVHKRGVELLAIGIERGCGDKRISSKRKHYQEGGLLQPSFHDQLSIF